VEIIIWVGSLQFGEERLEAMLPHVRAPIEEISHHQFVDEDEIALILGHIAHDNEANTTWEKLSQAHD